MYNKCKSDEYLPTNEEQAANATHKKNSLGAQSIFRSFEEKKNERKCEEERKKESKCESNGIAHKSGMFFQFYFVKSLF